MSATTVSSAGRDKIAAREGRRFVAYQDSVGVWTIGVGHTGRMTPPQVTKGMSITSAQCDAFLEGDLAPVETAIKESVKVPLTQNQFDACASLAFNIGTNGFIGSTVVHKLNAGDYDDAAKAFLMWEKPPALKARRESECAQFLLPDTAPQEFASNPSSASPAPGSKATATPPPKETSMENPTKTAAAKTTAASKGIIGEAEIAGVDILSGLKNIFTQTATAIASSVQTTSSGVSEISTVVSGLSGSVGNAEAAISEIKGLVTDLEGSKFSDVPEDIIALIKTFMAILAKFNINIPFVSQILALLPTLPSVTATSS